MKPAPFLYDCPRQESELLALLQEWGGTAKVLAGGQSLMPMLNMRLARPEAIIDLNALAGWDTVEQEDGRLRIGSMVRHQTLVESIAVREALPIIPEALSHIGHVAIRHRGSIGGSLAHADPSAEQALLLVLLQGSVETFGVHGSRTIPGDQMFQTYFTTALEPDEVIRWVHYPVPRRPRGWAFREVVQTPGAFAVVAAGAFFEAADGGESLQGALAVSGLGPVPLRFPIGPDVCSNGGTGWVRAWVDRILEPLEFEGDLHIDPATRRELAQATITGALLEALTPRSEGGDRP